MQRWSFLPVFALVLGACDRSPPPEPEPVFWQCGDEGGLEFHAARSDAGVTLTLPGRTVELAAVGDGGERFARNEVHLELESRREGAAPTAVLRVALDEHRCRPKEWAGPWAEAKARGAEFRAVGQEPGWFVEVVPGGELTAVLDYGDTRLALPAPRVTSLDGGARGYQAEADGVVVQVVIEPLVCFDAMSGQVYPETVTLAHAGRRYDGCGMGFAK